MTYANACWKLRPNQAANKRLNASRNTPAGSLCSATSKYRPRYPNRSGTNMTASDNTNPMSWRPVYAPFIAAFTFPFAWLHYHPYLFSHGYRFIYASVLVGWVVVAAWGIAGIAICMLRGSKNQQLVALIAIPAFVPIAALSFVLLYLCGYWSMSPL